MSVRLFVRNLNPDTTEEQLARFIASACTVLSAEVPRDWETGRSFGYGFVELPSEEEAERALTVFDGRWFGRRALRLERARNQRQRGRGEGPPANRRRRGQGTDPPGRRPAGTGDDDELDARPRKRRGGKHGSDRLRRHGTRRWIE